MIGYFWPLCRVTAPAWCWETEQPSFMWFWTAILHQSQQQVWFVFRPQGVIVSESWSSLMCWFDICSSSSSNELNWNFIFALHFLQMTISFSWILKLITSGVPQGSVLGSVLFAVAHCLHTPQNPQIIRQWFITVPMIQNKTIEGAFSQYGPTPWNTLPNDLRYPQLCHPLKTSLRPTSSFWSMNN